MRKPLTLAAAMFAALVLSSCASASPTPAPSTPPPATETPAAMTITLDELQSKYVAAGGQCDSISLRAKSAVSEASGDCDGGALLSIYASRAEVDGAIRILEGLQVTNPSPHVIAVGDDWIVNGANAGDFAIAMGGEPRQIGKPIPTAQTTHDLSTDEGLCAADAELTNLELNDAIAPLLGFSPDRDARSSYQDDAIREYKNSAFLRACPARAS